jgi:hypothetical protein
MKKIFFNIIIGIILISYLCCCGAKTAYVSVDRYLPTEISSGESVVILLNESREYGINIESESKERSIENCLKNAMTNENIQWKIVSAKDFRRTIFPGMRYGDTPRTVENLLLFLQDGKSRHQVEMQRIRYLIVVDTNTYNYGEKSDFAANQAGMVLSQTWTRSSNFIAFVIDVSQSAKSGAFSSNSSGKAGYVVPFIIIIPLPPVPIFALTESEACSALGTAVVKFLEGREEPSEEKKIE